MMLGLLAAILVLAVTLLIVYLVADIRSRPIKSVEIASNYRKLSEQIVNLIHDQNATLKDILPLMVEWAKLDALIRGKDPELRNQVVAVFLMHGYPFENTRLEITDYINNTGVPPKASPPPARVEFGPPAPVLGPPLPMPMDEVPEGAVIH